MSKMSLSAAWEDSKRIFARDGSLLTAVALALLVLPDIIAGLFAPSVEASPSLSGRIIALVAAFVGVIGQLAIVRLAIGPSTTVGQAIGHGMRRFPATFGSLVILGFGLALIMIPLMAVLMATGLVEITDGAVTPSFAKAVMIFALACLLVAPRFIMTVPVASAEPVGSFGILKRSWTLSSGSYWPLLGLVILLLVVAAVLMIAAQFVGGAIASLVGEVSPFSLSALILAVFVAAAQAVVSVLAAVMLARIYLQLTSGRPSVPTTGT